MANTTKQISARERSRLVSLKFYEREKEREQVQLRYFQAMDAVEKVNEVRDREVAAAEARAQEAAKAAMRTAGAAIVELLELKVTRSEIQERLGCSAADIRRAEGEAHIEKHGAAAAAGDGAGAAGADVPVE